MIAMLAGVRSAHPTICCAAWNSSRSARSTPRSTACTWSAPARPAPARIAEVSGGSVIGERLNGTVKGNAAADWMRTSKDGIASLDVRVVVETDDGALIYITYEGRAD